MAAKKATRGFTAGTAFGGSRSDGSGSHSPQVRGDRIITAADRPGRLVGPAPKMVSDSADGVVTKPKRHTSQGWAKNTGVDQVES